MTVASVVLAILALGVLIVFHEGGHFLAARWSRMSVRRFSIGFGPVVAKFERGGTLYQIGIILLGGFVQIDGMSPHDGSDPKLESSYLNKPFHLRFATILAGPVANYLLGFVLLAVFFALFNAESLPPVKVRRVVEGTPAAAAGLKVNDHLVGTTTAAFEKTEDLLLVVDQSGGQPVDFVVVRDAEELRIAITPQATEGGYRIGIEFSGSRRVDRPLGLIDGAAAAWTTTWRLSAELLKGLALLVTPGTKVTVKGPVGMVADLSEEVKSSWTGALGYIAKLSIMLGLFNLLPIPALDGSRLLFLVVGLVRRKEIEPKVEAVVHAVGLILLLALMLAISVGDVLNF